MKENPLYSEWVKDKNYWVNTETGEKRIWHPLTVEMGEHVFKSAEKLTDSLNTERKKLKYKGK